MRGLRPSRRLHSCRRGVAPMKRFPDEGIETHLPSPVALLVDSTPMKRFPDEGIETQAQDSAR